MKQHNKKNQYNRICHNTTWWETTQIDTKDMTWQETTRQIRTSASCVTNVKRLISATEEEWAGKLLECYSLPLVETWNTSPCSCEIFQWGRFIRKLLIDINLTTDHYLLIFGSCFICCRGLETQINGACEASSCVMNKMSHLSSVKLLKQLIRSGHINTMKMYNTFTAYCTVYVKKSPENQTTECGHMAVSADQFVNVWFK